MHHYFPLITVLIIITLCGVNGLNSKLDFGDDSASSASVIKNHRNIPFKYKPSETFIETTTKNVDVASSFVCNSKGCNSTKSKEKKVKDGGELIKTDIVVHVKTTVDVKNKTKEIGDVPDIPVVLGTNGIGYKNVQRGLHFEPIPRSYGVKNIHQAFPSLTSTLVPLNLYKSGFADGVDIKIKTLPPVMISMSDGYQYEMNGVELKIPHFEQTYHSHYYGENSPPQMVFTNRKNTMNPVAFSGIVRPPNDLSSISRHYPVFTQNNYRHDPNCKCEQNPSGLHWYPKGESRTFRYGTPPSPSVNVNDPGTEINDKLAPLNS